jgi:hypothetical protein
MIFWLVLKLEISYRVIIELFLKVKQTQHPEFGHTEGEIQKTLQTSTLAFKGG